MTEQEKQTVKAAKEFGASDLTQDLVILIERLDKQLTEIKEAGKFIDELVQLANKADKVDDDYWLMDCGGGRLSEVEIGQVRRLAEAMKEVKDE